ncbi:hypothetical protein [Leucobacter triazinivorans]|uniref:Uncharacterized protein n=1 Tax=Leucobacter triazinivorans TaxID=1784719 RepID=A0A4P6KIK3_9MICO|nr:hypothetical protein [Leucobacter triazinivorans]QBE49828.1 hypothetical protein EVS81_14165 [Leucobacter triazinivorans]
MPSSRTPLSTLTGVALIVLPLLAWALKLFSFGWMMVFILFGPILLLIAGYVLQIVVAAQGFLSKRELFRAAKPRATVAAWVTSLGVLALGVFMPDGGDMDYGSTFQVWAGAYGPNSEAVHAATDALNSVVATGAALLWIAGFVWLLVEWIAALIRRRRAARPAG